MKTIIKKSMHNPPHPGETIRLLCLEPLALTVTKAAKALGVSRKMLSQVIHGHTRITPNLAMRLAKAFNTSPESWLNQQMQYDLWQEAQQQNFKEVRALYED